MIAILGFIGILVLGFIILGLIGWGVQALGFFASFLGEGITREFNKQVQNYEMFL